MIADTKPDDDKILMELEKSVDGENVAFIYNSSTPASTCNVRFSFKCMGANNVSLNILHRRDCFAEQKS